MKFLAVFGNGMTERSIEAYTVVEAQNKAVEIASHYAGGKWQELSFAALRRTAIAERQSTSKKNTQTSGGKNNETITNRRH